MSVNVLTVNAGSSSIKLALFKINGAPEQLLGAAVEHIGQPEARLIVKGGGVADDSSHPVVAQDHTAAAEMLVDWVKQHMSSDAISAVGHRIVHGGPKYYEPCVIDDEVLEDLRKLTIFDPVHLPTDVKLIEAFQRLLPDAEQVACFDTAFHHDLPDGARLLPIPRRYETQGIRRYGFHGLSYQFLMQELRRLDAPAAGGRLILAHLGNGVSLAAVRDGKPVDTTMGLTPASGVPMSTRSGDLDPGLALFLARSENLDAEAFNDMANFKSGLLGVSETTSDMEALLDHEASDRRAKVAVDLFCYQVKKSIGGLAAALGGLDALVFTGGMGENAPKIRARVCDGLEFLGIKIEAARNLSGAEVISADDSRVTVRVIRSDEALMIAQNVRQLMTDKARPGNETAQ